MHKLHHTLDPHRERLAGLGIRVAGQYGETTGQEKVGLVAALLLATIIFMNLNGVMFMMYGVAGSLSYVMLFLAGAVLFSHSRYLTTCVEVHGAIFFCFVFLYIALGTIVAVLGDFDGEFSDIIISLLSTIAITYAFASCAFALAMRQRTAPALQILVVIVLISTLSVPASPVLYEYFIWIPLSSEQRSSGFFANPNEAGLVACIGLAIGSALLLSQNATRLSNILLPVAIVSIFLTLSRGALIGALGVLTFGLVASLLKTSASGKSQTVMFFALFFVLAASVLFVVMGGIEELDLFSPEQQKRLGELGRVLSQGEISDETTADRAGIATYALQMWSEKPLFGHGLGAMHLLKDIGLGVHNTFLMVLGESGILPLAILLLWITTIVYWSAHELNSVVGLMVWLYMPILVISMATSHNTLDNRFHNAVCGIIFGLISFRRAVSKNI